MSEIITIGNQHIQAQISTKGAELQSLYHKALQQEYIWEANPNFWAKKSPVLFPIVGGLKNNSYTYNGKEYMLNRHGFAREMEFNITGNSNDSVTFSIASSNNTLNVYPFEFVFSITYTVENNKLIVSYKVASMDKEIMYFSVGAHPAFKVPLGQDTVFTDYYLQLSHVENAGIYPLDAHGLLETNPIPFLNNQQTIPLTKPLFYKDALVFKHLQSNSISILNTQNKHGLTVGYEGFPYMGIWSFKDADFVCIEPWCGIADSVNSTGNLQQKEGILLLDSFETIEKNWWIEVF
jgi:galactose mutarotase-like enzyme